MKFSKSKIRILMLVLTAVGTLFFVRTKTENLAQAQSKPNKPPGLQCAHIDPIERVYLNAHVSYTSPSTKLEDRAVEQYIKRVDSAKIYLLDSDIKQMKSKTLKDIFKKLGERNCKPLEEVQALIQKRVAERVEYAKKVLEDKNWKFEPSTEIMIDPDSRSFAKTSKDADAFQKKYLQFQVSNFIASGEVEKAKAANKENKAADAKNETGDKSADKVTDKTTDKSSDKTKTDEKAENKTDSKTEEPKSKIAKSVKVKSAKDKKATDEIPKFSKEAIDEAKASVIRSYERILKRINETSKDDIYSGYLDSFARALDPHSSYLPNDQNEDFNIQMGLKLEGIGATLSSQDGFTVVEQLIGGGPAKESGLILPQDKIVAVGQFNNSGEAEKMVDVVEMDLRDVVRLIRGPKGTKVVLTIVRKTSAGKERFNVTLTRAQVKLEDEAVSVSYVEKELSGVKKKIAIMNLPSFYADSKPGGRSASSDMKKLLAEIRAQKADALVLDLSNNGGGSLDDAVKIAGFFFKTGNVVKQSTHSPEDEILFKDKDSDVDWSGPTVVLTSRISASASEIVSSTLKDYQRAVIVGADHTFGKGTVQQVMQLPSGIGALKVTVGMFYTPGGFSTQHRGVEADVQLPGIFSTDEIGEQFLDYSLPKSQIKPFLSEEAYVTTGSDTWKKLDRSTIEALKKQSDVRVSKNTEFQKIKTDLKKAKTHGKKIKLVEALKETKEKKTEREKKKEESKEEKVADYLKRADIQEASQVALDLIELQSKTSETK